MKRSGWKPNIVDGEPANATDSKFLGAPFLPAGSVWPQCGVCHREFLFAMQINLEGTVNIIFF